METKLITLITDFGHKDPFVGIMKGVIFGINPNARTIDLSHGIPPQDLMAGSLVLRYSAPFFPRGTIHVAVVDPEVGTKRRPLLIESEGCFFIGPDNGILSLALEGKETNQTIELSNEIYHLKPTSATFHGRDIFAPIAGYLSLGIPPQDLGTRVNGFARLPWPQVIRKDQVIQGEIVYIDGFGNLITNIHEHDLRRLQSENLTVSLGPLTVQGLAPNYTSGGEGGYVALINSWGLLEISLFKGN
ncbi:MAG: S-adenosyl-l-methionine hydroxide adenosyltransferase family protein, partial [Candidatus Binatia bacterium]